MPTNTSSPSDTSSTSRISIPLYTRSSDRSISDCTARFHLEAQGAPHTGASWYAIGTALHTAFERVLKKPPKRFQTAQRWARDELRKELADMQEPYLSSPHRPIDGKSEFYLADELMLNFWKDIIEDQKSPVWMDAPFELEKVVNVASKDWEFEAGASTTIDFVQRQGDTHTLIIDWKTGRSRRSDPMQLQIYRYLLELHGYPFEPGHVWGLFYHAEHRTLQVVDEYDLDAVERMIRETQVLKQLPHPEPSPNWFCDYCPFKISCPAWEEDEHDAHVMQTQLNENVKRYQYRLDAE